MNQNSVPIKELRKQISQSILIHQGFEPCGYMVQAQLLPGPDVHCRLLDRVKPLFPVVQAHHITLGFNVSWVALAALVQQYGDARFIVYRGTHVVWNRSVQVLVVSGPCLHPHPHVTISHTRRVGPRKANTLFSSDQRVTRFVRSKTLRCPLVLAAELTVLPLQKQ